MWTKESALQTLKENYTKIGHPIAFSNVTAIFNYFGKVLSQSDIKTFLSSINTYTTHRENRRKARSYIPIFSLNPRDLIEIDLIDMKYFKPSENDKIRYLLIAVDSFTRLIDCEAIPNKETSTVLEAFKKIHKRLTSTGIRIKAACSDLGSEFINRHFKQYLQDHFIQIRHSKRLNHCPTVERANRSLQGLIGRFCTNRNTMRYIDHLPEILFTFNSRVNRMIKTSPFIAELPQSHDKLREILFKRLRNIKKQKAKFSLGQMIRISREIKTWKDIRSFQSQITQQIMSEKKREMATLQLLR